MLLPRTPSSTAHQPFLSPASVVASSGAVSDRLFGLAAAQTVRWTLLVPTAPIHPSPALPSPGRISRYQKKNDEAANALMCTHMSESEYRHVYAVHLGQQVGIGTRQQHNVQHRHTAMPAMPYCIHSQYAMASSNANVTPLQQVVDVMLWVPTSGTAPPKRMVSPCPRIAPSLSSLAPSP